MAVKDSFSGTNGEQVTAASVGPVGDLQGFNSAAIIFSSGTTPSAPSIEVSEDGVSYAAADTADLLFTDANGDTQNGLPTLVDDTVQIVRYRGFGFQFIRAGATNAVAVLLRNYPSQSPALP